MFATNAIPLYLIFCILSNIYIHLSISTNYNTLLLSSSLSSLSNKSIFKSFGGIIMKKSFQLYVFMLSELSWRRILRNLKKFKLNKSWRFKNV